MLDRLTGTNTWLDGRTLDASPETIGQLAAAFVHGAQSGGVITFAKHFPGFPHVTHDPAETEAQVPAGCWTDEQLSPFRDMINAGTLGVMTGPAPVMDLDPTRPASTSVSIVSLLRADLGFTGLILSDDLDAPATTMGRSVQQTAVDAIVAGIELLLMAGGEEVGDVASALIDTARTNKTFAEKLRSSAQHVRVTRRTLTK